MAISMGSGGNDKPIGEMNTTPLIDVMLVLLIMFIITIPPQTHAVKIDLPVPPHENVEKPIDPIKNKIYISPEGIITWNGTSVNDSTLATFLEESKAIQPQPELQFEPDPLSRYVITDQTLALIKRSEVGGLGFVGNERYAREF